MRAFGNAGSDQWRTQPKIFLGPKHLILGKQQYFVWDTASQSTKWLDILKIWEALPPGYACGSDAPLR